MSDDLKERLSTWDGDSSTIDEALAYITELEARLAAAEAGEDALTGALRGATETLRGASRQLTEVHRGNLKGRVWGQMTLEIVSAALAAYEARRKG